jgi:hypothetical protein
MTKGRRLEGPRAPLFYSAAATLLLCGKIATAQTVDLSAMEDCAVLETPELQLSCFNAIIADNKTPDTRQDEAVAKPESESPAAEIATVPETQPPVEIDPQEAPPVEAVTDTAPSVEATTAVAVAVTTRPPAPEPSTVPEPSPAAAVPTPEPVAANEAGQEHLQRAEKKAKEEDDKILHATVIEVSEGRNDILYFHFANGQVWRQNEARTLTYPKRGEFDIVITRGMMGDYRMRIGDNGRMVRIRRVQ